MEKSTKKETNSQTTSTPINEGVEKVSCKDNSKTNLGILSREANAREIMHRFSALDYEYKKAVASIIPNEILGEEVAIRLIRQGNNLQSIKEYIERVMGNED